MLLIGFLALSTGVSGATISQVPFVLENTLRNVPGNSIVRLCPESRQDDLLAIERIVNEPQVPYLDEEQHVYIWGNFSRDIPEFSTVDYQINATANNGDSGAYNGTFHICDYLERMQQPPDSEEPAKVCPPTKGSAFIDYFPPLVSILVAPGQWRVKFDAKAPNGDRIFCLQTEFDLQCPPWHEGPECLRDAAAGKRDRKRALGELDRWRRGHDLALSWPRRQ